MFNYVVTAQKPTSVTHSLTGHFTGSTDDNLIIGKTTIIEIHKMTPEGVTPMLEVPIYGRISTMQLFTLPGDNKHSLFLLTERYNLCILSYDQETNEIITRASGDVQDRIGRPVENGQIGIIDPQHRLIALHLYEGLLKIVPFDKQQVKEAFNIRLEEFNVIDIKFLEHVSLSKNKKIELPTIAVLHQDPKNARHVKTYQISVKDKEFIEGPFHIPNVEAGSSILIPVPPPLGGLIIIGEQQISYHDGISHKSISLDGPIIIRSYGVIDNGRWLMGDDEGFLYVLSLQKGGINYEKVGKTSVASTISYLDAAHVFIGSTFGDSQLIKLNQEKDEKGSFLDVIATYTNLGPIVDFCVVDLEKQGQGQIVACCGAMKDGSLRIVRNGIGIDEQSRIELEGIKGLWNIKQSLSDDNTAYIVITFIGATRSLGMDHEGDLGEIDIPGLDTQALTLSCANVIDNHFIQVTEKAVRLIDCANHQLVDSWTPAEGQIYLASISPSQIVLSLGQGNLMYLEIRGKKIHQTSNVKLEHEVSSLDIHSLGSDSKSSLLAVGLWTDISIRILKLPSLEEINREKLGGDILPRSLLFATFENINYLLCALGDGHLITFKVDQTSGKLFERKKVSLGTKPVLLTQFTSKGNHHVFASSDRPTVVYSSNQKLLYSNVNLKDVNYMCPFSTENFPDGFAIAREDFLMLGSIDEIQKLHIRTIPLGEQPRRIAYQESTSTFAVGTIRQISGGEEANLVRLMDSQTFEFVYEYPLEQTEYLSSITSCKFTEDETEYYVVGTAYVSPEEDDVAKGRILILEVENDKLSLVTEKEVKGAVYSMTGFNGKLLTCVNSKVILWKFQESNEGKELTQECYHANNVLALSVQTRGDFIIVGDLMKSITLLVYKPVDGTLEQISKDYNAMWITATQIIDDDTFIGAENNYNLFTVRKNLDADSEEEKRRLHIAGLYHVGDLINTIQHGTLVMKPPEGETIKTLLYGTVSGAIGVIAQLSFEKYEFFSLVQDALNKVIKGVGGLSHENWRSFASERKKEKSQNFLDGDLIESFLDLKRDKMQEVIDFLKLSLSEKNTTMTKSSSTTTTSSSSSQSSSSITSSSSSTTTTTTSNPLLCGTITVEELSKRIEELATSLH